MENIFLWLEPSIDKRVSEISDDILVSEKENGYIAFMDLLRTKVNIPPEIIMELGDIFISHTQETVEESYKKGVMEMLILKS
ncbi:hypothetical protein CA600_12295 [Paenibacillus sp. VTT E-133280]|uniref:hypothetical protein n=1 Tax=Paenibacillus sp. VTT E-133280 TaxID=1986222 RepID=UPI000BA00553|nr:hypothetical protein [Paenibacillus sp. VTT E-133280]OZQ66034.1 hypothetical protein CA600_12295 [Paenibacillus sp. VTT E-133280]